MTTEISGLDVSIQNIAGAAEEGDRVTVSGVSKGSRGFSDNEWEYTGVITDIGEREIHIACDDEDHDYYLKKSGIKVQMNRKLEGKGDWTLAGLKTVKIH